MSGPAFEDDGLSSEEEDDDDEGDVFTDDMLGAPSDGVTPQFEFRELKLSPLIITGDLPSHGSPSISPKSGANVMVVEPTPIDTVPPPSPLSSEREKEKGEKKEKKSSFSALTKGIRRPTFSPRQSSLGLTSGPVPPPGISGTASEPGSGTSTPMLKPGSLPGEKQSSKKMRPKFKRSKASEYNFVTNNDILGIVMLEIIGAENLPRVKNSKYSFYSLYCLSQRIQ
jgi:phosphatidylserine decarboxylase